ncbi:MAG: helix-turn-helix domain-containing protein [Gammaproteobacteria bacterium]|nr:helix-turn-helix domain-containing protein [Gammaproteobacteria bacterium]
MRANTIAVIAFNNICPFHLAVPIAVFAEDRCDAGVPKFELLVCAAERGALQTSGGFSINVSYGLRDLAKAKTIIVPSWRNPDELPPADLLTALRKAHARGARLVGLCLGAFVLAAAGILDRRPATTHWLWAPAFAKRYPQVQVKPDVLYVDDGDVLTSAGTAAGIDCCLHLLRRQYGAEAASRVARRLVVPPHRQGGQAQYIEQPLPKTETIDRFSEVLTGMAKHLERPHRLDGLAKRALMSRRTFTRRFRQVTGTTVGKWLLNQRLSMAQRLLETTDKPVERIAQLAGFGSSVSLRQRFATAFKISPSAYRREFRGS